MSEKSKPGVPPFVLYHGTSLSNHEDIKLFGLLKMNRKHVQLSATRDAALNVGTRRRTQLTVLTIDAKRMLADGCVFFVSENGVWLVEFVHPKYINFES